MENFKIVTNKSLGGSLRGQINGAAKQLWTFWNILFNCVNRCYEHNDVSWVNRGLEMARAVGRFKVALFILKQLVPYSYTTELGFHGKRKGGKFDEMQNTYQAIMHSLVGEQQEADSKPKVSKPFELDSALENLYKRANKAGVSNDDILAAVIDLNKLALAA